MKDITTDQFCRVFGCTHEQAAALAEKNVAQLREMRAKALDTGKKVNGYTAEMLSEAIDGLKAKWGLQ